MKRKKYNCDILVIGGGVTGSAVAYGLRRQKCNVIMLDASPGALGIDKASRSNMGLIWCQSKFVHLPPYARWAFIASNQYSDLVCAVQEDSGIEVNYRPCGGIIACLGDEEFNQKKNYLEKLRLAVDPQYPAEMMSRNDLSKKLPHVDFGDEVSGGVWCDRDGFIEPLKLLYALRKAFVRQGGIFYPNVPVLRIVSKNGGYVSTTPLGDFYADRIVLAAGLSNKKLCHNFGYSLSIFADKGQVLLTERIDDILPIPVLGITRTPGGTVMIGFMHERAGYDTRAEPSSVRKEGLWAMRVWPLLGNLQIIRTWSGLRVMPNDGQAIYDTIPGHPNVYVINSHSCVTLVPVHERQIANWINCGGPLPAEASTFTLQRFQEQALEYK